MKRVLGALVLFAGLLWSGHGWAANAISVESKGVVTGATGITLGVFVENDVSLMAMVLPLEIRAVDAGSFIADTLTLIVQGRVAASGLMDLDTLTFRPTPEAVNSCSGPISSTYATVAPVDFVTPDALMWMGLKTSSASLAPGSDGVTPSFLLFFDVTHSPGAFEIDSCCTMPANHLVFIDDLINEIVPSFTKGVITIVSPNQCPVIAGFGTDPLTAIVGTEASNTTSASDPEADPIAYYLVSGPGSVAMATGDWVYTPVCDDVPGFAVVIEATDRGPGQCPNDTFQVAVVPPPLEVSCPADLAVH